MVKQKWKRKNLVAVPEESPSPGDDNEAREDGRVVE